MQNEPKSTCATKGGSVQKSPASKKEAPPMADLIAIDVETGGTMAGVHAILSIAAVTVSGGTFHRLIRPDRGLKLDAEALRVNGYTPEAWMAGGAVSLVQAAEEFRQFVTAQKKESGAWIPLAHNAGFDKGFIGWLECHVGFEFGLSYRWECSMSLLAALGRVGIVPRGKASLDRLCELAFIQRETPHCALSDAAACLHGYGWLLRQISEKMEARP